MSSRTDLGWFTWAADQPASNLVSKSISTDARGNTYFSSRVASGSADPSFFLLDTWVPGTARLGKTGAYFPIDTTTYNTLYVKMKVTSDVLAQIPVAQVFWSRDSIYYDPGERPAGGTILAATAAGAQTGVFLTPTASEPYGHLEGGAWVVYRIPLTIAEMRAQNGSTHIDHWKNANGGSVADWGAAGVLADSLRFSPFNLADSAVGEVQVDWVRLVDYEAGNSTTVNWTGGGTYDVVVSTRDDCSDFAVIAYSASSGLQFQSQVLPPGTYRVGLRLPFTRTGHTAPDGAALSACSTGTFTVRAYPALTLTTPGEEGSADDFATAFLSNGWDFDALTDIDYARNVSYPDASYGIVSMPATDAAGTDLGPVRVYRNLSANAGDVVGDPHIYTLWPIPAPPAPAGTRARGLVNHIDASRCRILTAEVGVERSRDLSRGSIARLIWHVAGDVRNTGSLAETESSDITLRHLDPAGENGGRIVLDTIQVDMADRWSLPIETDTPQSASGWNNTCTASGSFACNLGAASYKPGIDIFRLDFHEFSAATASEVRRIKLAALERTGASYTVRWTTSNPSGLSASVALRAVPEVDPARGNFRPVDPGCSTASSIPIASGIPLSSGSYTWTPSTTAGLTSGAEYYVCAQVFVGGVSAAVDETLSRWPVVVDTSYTGPKPTLQLDRTSLRLAAVATGSKSPRFSSKTPAQTVRFTQNGAGTIDWTVSVTDNNGTPVNWLAVSPSSGRGGGTLTIGLNDAASFPVCTATDGLQAVVRLTSSAMGNDPQHVQVSATIYPGATATTNSSCAQPKGATSPPFGQVDTPTQNATGVVGSIGITGWVLDDVGVTGVRIYRNCLAFEAQTNCALVAGYNLVYVGDAVFVAGARPDVEAVYPRYPQAYRAGWGYLMLTNLLPHVPNAQMYGGQGQLSFYAFASDAEGQLTLLGRSVATHTPTTITMANDTIAKPFGAIDTPTQGETVSGVAVNFGWALTPDGDTTAGDGGDVSVPVDGSTVTVFVDGAPLGTAAYDQCRGSVGYKVPAGLHCDDDIASIFGNPTPQPTYQVRTSNPTRFRNLDAGRGAIAAYLIDTTTLADGLHTLVWGVTDSLGRSEGIGSRFFNVLNGTADAAAGDQVSGAARDAAPVATVTSDSGPVLGRTTFDLRAPWEPVEPGLDGERRVRIPELGRLELYLGDDTREGCLAANGVRRALPPGSRLKDGYFTWAPGAGQVGDFTLVFQRAGGQVAVVVTILPASDRKERIVGYIDTPGRRAAVRSGFRVAGWAADLAAWTGSGVGAVHVWAQPRGTPGAPVFLGAAEIGVSRPDVAAAYGPQYGHAGWSVVSAPLPPGSYDVTAYFWCARTGRFEDARTVRLTVR